MKNHSIVIAPIIFIAISAVFSQPESRFDPFDWVVYRQVGAINSITEGFSYVYFGTQDGGILRYHLYRNDFDAPITTAQGLTDNHIRVVHFDRETGTLWAATENTLEYSYTREGDWYHINLDETGLYPGARVIQIGSSNQYIWILAGNLYLKLDRISGIMLGIMPNPDEEQIIWSTTRLLAGMELPYDLMDYPVMDGWLLNGNQLVDPFGQFVDVTTVFRGQFNDYWLGAEDGSIFFGDTHMETLYPLVYGLSNTDVMTMTFGEHFWLAGRHGYGTEGVTLFNPENGTFNHIDFKTTINMNPQSLYSVIDIQEEVWFGGEQGILVYHKKDDFWRLIAEAKGIPTGPILTMAQDTAYVWVGSPHGIGRISKTLKRAVPVGIENPLREEFIYDLEMVDNQLWIGTVYGLYVYDYQQESLLNFHQIGDIEKIAKSKDVFSNFWKIEHDDNRLFIATPQAILLYDLKSKEWDIALEPSEYQGRRITAMALYENQCFLGTDNGVIRIDLKHHFKREYKYPFIGRVNEIVISHKSLWLGTSRGLIKFSWRTDL